MPGRGTQPPRPCPLCGGASPRPLRGYAHAHLVRCASCSFTFAGRVPDAAELERHYAGYALDDPDSPITRARYAALLDGFEAHRATNRILDMGSGVGHFLDEAARRGWEVHGTEVTARARERASARGIAMHPAPLRPEDHPEAGYDVVCAFEVVEHLADPAAEARALGRVLRPGGAFYATTPNFDALSRRVLGPRWSVVEWPEHLSYFTRATLTRWAALAGLVPERLVTTGVSPRRLRDGLRGGGGGGGGGGPVPAAGAVVSASGGDEVLREAIERSRALRAARTAADAALGAAHAGDALKGWFRRPSA